MELAFHSPIRDDGRRGFPDWLRALRGENGVYLIRHADTAEVLYIGESHRNRLYETLTRHLQSWSGFGSGPSYAPDVVEIAVLLTDADTATLQQFALIQELQPVDNVQDGRSLFSLAYEPAELAEPDRESDADDDQAAGADHLDEVPF